MARKPGQGNKRFSITLDLDALDEVSKGLDQLTPAQLGKLQVSTVNETMDYAYDTTRQGMIDRVNLPETYIDGKVQREPAQPGGRARASLFVNNQLTILTRFPGYKVLMKPINDPSYVERYGRKGDRRFGIPVGLKQAGVQVNVLRGSSKVFEHGFLMKLKNGNGYGLFARPKDGGKPKHRYGPAIYSLFREQLDRKTENITDHMVEHYSAAIDIEINRVF
jgi:hypothetical protein